MPQKKWRVLYVEARSLGADTTPLRFWSVIRTRSGETCFRAGRWGEKSLSVASMDSLNRQGKVIRLDQPAIIGLRDNFFPTADGRIVAGTSPQDPTAREVGQMLSVEAKPAPISQGLGTPRSRFGDPLFG